MNEPDTTRIDVADELRQLIEDVELAIVHWGDEQVLEDLTAALCTYQEAAAKIAEGVRRPATSRECLPNIAPTPSASSLTAAVAVVDEHFRMRCPDTIRNRCQHSPDAIATEMLAAAYAAERPIAERLAAALWTVRRQCHVQHAGHALTVILEEQLAEIDAALAEFTSAQPTEEQ